MNALNTRLVRNKSGDRLHRHDCGHIKNRGFPWNWAEDKSLETIEASMAKIGIEVCLDCDPLKGWKGPFHACAFREGCDCTGVCRAYTLHASGVCCRPGSGDRPASAPAPSPPPSATTDTVS